MDPPDTDPLKKLKWAGPDPDPTDCFGTSPVCSLTDGQDTGFTNKTGGSARNQQKSMFTKDWEQTGGAWSLQETEQEARYLPDT